MSLDENVCDDGGYRRFALIETSRGHAVFDVGRLAAATQHDFNIS